MNAKARALRDALAAFEASGKVVVTLRLHPDGTIDLLTQAAPEKPLADDDGDWLSLAGTPETRPPRP